MFPADPAMSNQTTSLDYALQNPANVTVTVLDSSGTVVKTIQTAVSEQTGTCGWYSYCYNVSWDGTDDQGQIVAPGQYTIQVVAVQPGRHPDHHALRDVADIPAPGILTTPTNGATRSRARPASSSPRTRRSLRATPPPTLT